MVTDDVTAAKAELEAKSEPLWNELGELNRKCGFRVGARTPEDRARVLAIFLEIDRNNEEFDALYPAFGCAECGGEVLPRRGERINYFRCSEAGVPG